MISVINLLLGKFEHNNKIYDCGSSTSEQRTALLVNDMCSKIGIPLKNNGLEILFEDL